MSKQQQIALRDTRQSQELPPANDAVEPREKSASTFDALKRSSSLMRVVVFGPVDEIIRRANETAGLPLHQPPKATTAKDPRPVGGLMKRCVDILIAVTLIILLWPLMTIVALLIKINMGGPVIFAHPRVGANGRAFKCYKFRTMVGNAEQALLQHLAANPESKKEWEKTAKLKNDPRVTKLGRLLRRSSIDELPQLLNVLKGEMSCVGPRPVVAAELAPYGEHTSDYLAARPGLSGIWQVSGRNSVSYSNRVKLDSLYVRRWSMALDLAILVATIPAVLRSRETS